MEENEAGELVCPPVEPVTERAPSYPIVWGLTFFLGLIAWIGLVLTMLSDTGSHAGESYFIVSGILFAPFMILSFSGFWRHFSQSNSIAIRTPKSLNMPKRALVGYVLLCQLFVLLALMLPFMEFNSSMTSAAVMSFFGFYLLVAMVLWLLPEDVHLVKRIRLSGRMRHALAAAYSLIVQLFFLIMLAFFTGMADFMIGFPHD